MSELIPVLVLTGYLGAGKTTLLNRILSGDQGRRYAVIVNEFGEIGIDNELILSAEEELLELSNGCICCTVRGDLIRTLHRLLSKHGAFDCIAIETTGIAAPGPVVQTFFVDPLLQARTCVDSVTTVVDALHIDLSLANSPEALEQIAFADQIVLNKTERVAEEELRRIEGRLKRLNRIAPIHRAQRANVSLDRLLGRRSFDLQHILLQEPDFLDATHAEASDGHEQGSHHDHDHGSNISSVSLTSHTPLKGSRLTAWLSNVVAVGAGSLLRAKGIFNVEGEARRWVFQSVHTLLEGDFQRPWRADEPRCSRLVFIGRNLDSQALRAGLASCEAAG